ncbi:MAG TPA: hemolysin III family protein [Clostridia bacterium]|nr:hemolysin III family protein [Clostridia bacterium]
MTKVKKLFDGEEIGNAISHGVGLGLSIAALVILIYVGLKYGDSRYVVSYSIYGSSLVILYLASTLYHSVPEGKVKDIFKIFDHSAIFILIAGTYTPITLIALKGRLGTTLFVIVWTIAFFGIVFKLFFSKKYKRLSTIMYLLMGWLIIFAIKPLLTNLNTISTIFLVSGGIVYSLGTIFYLWKNLKFNHLIWHFFVLGGSVCHFFMMYFLIIQ